jgi:DNA primase
VDIHKAKSVDKDWFIQEANLCTHKPHKSFCPFHQDTNPSLNLMKSNKGTYYLKCFSCGWFGDSIKYIQDRDGLSFIEAVKKIII